MDQRSAALLLTYICLFVVLDKFSELKVPSNNRHLEAGTGRETETETSEYSAKMT